MPRTPGERRELESLSISLQLAKSSTGTLHYILELKLGSGQISEKVFDVTEPSLVSLELAVSSLVAGMETTRDISLTPPTRLFLKMLLASYAQWLWTELKNESPRQWFSATFTIRSSPNVLTIPKSSSESARKWEG